MTETLSPLSIRAVRITGGFWAERQRLMTDVTIPYMEKILRDEVPGATKSHAMANFRMAAKEETGEFYGMVFQDSDVYKWLEAAAYSLAVKPDAALLERVGEVIALIGRAQQEDGYIGTYFTVKEPENRWANLLECHELYCAGHLLEAACALHEALGDDRLLLIACRMADHIISRFSEGGDEGIPGHQEIELGLMRLYHATGDIRYRDMALRFLNLRGQNPAWFREHTPTHPDIHYGDYDIDPADPIYNQSDVPVRQQTAARGHAVRQLYMLAAMASAADDPGDAELQTACERMFDHITQRQMYVTGGLGAQAHHEAFSVDFDLPNATAYNETCASVAMAFFARQMLRMTPDGRYTDILEKELYNGALAGMQLDGTRFFYVNPLEAIPGVSGAAPGYEHVLIERPQWYSCACCPPNLARLITSLGKYIWSETEDTVYMHLFAENTARTRHAALSVQTAYPWQGQVCCTIEEVYHGPFTLAIHVPGYVTAYTLLLNGKPVQAELQKGYLYLRHAFQQEDQVTLMFDMVPRRIYADSRVRACAGQVALARGPIVYCFEGVDNGHHLDALHLPRTSALHETPYAPDFLGGVVALDMTGAQQELLRAIPYYAWSNRGKNSMRVWINEASTHDDSFL